MQHDPTERRETSITSQVQSEPAAATRIQSRKWSKKRLRQNVPIMLMFLPVVLYFLIFRYAPMGGLIIAFKSYNFHDGIWGSPWVGLDNFRLLFTQPKMIEIIRNTFVLSFLQVVVGFPFPVMLAILLNEARKTGFKRIVQTIVYLPHFLHWVIIGGLIILIFSQEKGIVNHLLEPLLGSPFPFLYNPASWIMIFIGSGIWKSAGWNAIIYLAALASIDPALYESAGLDGAGKMRKIWHITLPSIRPTIIIMFILSVGHVMEVGFDQVYVLQNSVVSNVSEVISTWNFKVGINGGRFSLAAAMGFFESFVGLFLVILANRIARRFDQGLW